MIGDHFPLSGAEPLRHILTLTFVCILSNISHIDVVESDTVELSSRTSATCLTLWKTARRMMRA